MAYSHRVYRLARKKYANDLSGMGAFLSGGRWNSPGQYLLYTASSISLAMLEILVHVTKATLPDDLHLTIINIPVESFEKITSSDLPKDWRQQTENHITREIGDRWITNGENLMLKVPSAINPLEDNYLINPSHHLYNQVTIEQVIPWSFDLRLV